jgi:hypothetical protein
MPMLSLVHMRKSAGQRIVLTGLCWALCLLAAASPAGAARARLEPKVELGFNGAVRKTGGIYPVTITLKNDIATTEGTIEISQPGGPGGKAEVRYIQRFKSPAPSTKRFVIPVRVQASRSMVVRISYDKHIKTSFTLFDDISTASDKPLVLSVGAPEDHDKTSVSDAYRFVSVSKESIPEDPLLLTSVYAVMIHGIEFAKLSSAQLEALRRWVATGGVVIIVEPLQDEAFRRANTAAAPGANMRRKGVVRYHSGLVASSGIGESASPPFWTGDRATRAMLFPAYARQESDADDYSYDQTGIFTRLWRASKRSTGISIVWLLLFMTAYVCAIGPVDRWLVKRFHKPMLTWILFLVSIVGFSGIAYWYSALANIGSMRVVHVAVIDAAPGAGLARGEAMSWVYSAKNARYPITAGHDASCLTARESAISAGSVAGVDIAPGIPPVASARIPIFSSKVLDTTWYMGWTNNVVCRYDRAFDSYTVTIPANMSVRRVQVAEKKGLRTLRDLGNGTWKTRDSLVELWSGVAAPLDNALRLNSDSYGYGGSGTQATMPGQNPLDDLLVWLSFECLDSLGETSYAHGGYYNLPLANYREDSFRVTDRTLAQGRVLLLFLKEPGYAEPMTIPGNPPQKVTSYLVRIQLDETGSIGRNR